MSLINYFKETKSEMKHVSWPGRSQVTSLTILVLAISLGVGAMLGLFDWLFSLGLKDVLFR